MKVVSYLSTNSREQEIGRAIAAGFAKHGIQCINKTRSDFWVFGMDDEADIIAVVGVKSKKMFADCEAAGRIPLIIDKGYFGRGEYYRMSLGAYQPPGLVDKVVDGDRFRRCVPHGVQSRRTGGTAIMYCGSSQKYCNFHELGDNNDYARKVITEIYQNWNGPERSVIYRPKPSWWAKSKPGERRDNLNDLGVTFSGPDEPFPSVLARCHAIVTHGSNGAAEALAAGVPVIMTSEEGVSPVWSLCEHDMANIRSPFWPDKANIENILFSMAYYQFTISEMLSGFFWDQLGVDYRPAA